MRGTFMVMSLFDYFADSICSECRAYVEDGAAECMPGGKLCRFWADFEKLEALCKDTEELATSIKETAENYDE